MSGVSVNGVIKAHNPKNDFTTIAMIVNSELSFKTKENVK